MPNQKNQDQVQELTQQLAQSVGVVFVDYKGLTHNQLEELRNSLNEAGSDLHITKNTLLKIALAQAETTSNAAESGAEHLTGPTATIFLGEDSIAPIKVLATYIKQNELPVVKGGILDNAPLDKGSIKKLAELPSYDQLIAQLMGQLNAPITGLAVVVGGPIRSLVYALEAIRSKKGGETNG